MRDYIALHHITLGPNVFGLLKLHNDGQCGSSVYSHTVFIIGAKLLIQSLAPFVFYKTKRTVCPASFRC